jgi:hypothetical protein
LLAYGERMRSALQPYSVIPWLALGIVLVIGAVIAQTRHAG